jgi:hypothetical protein
MKPFEVFHPDTIGRSAEKAIRPIDVQVVTKGLILFKKV